MEDAYKMLDQQETEREALLEQQNQQLYNNFSTKIQQTHLQTAVEHQRK